MKERPILMSGPTVRAILEGTKTQTRRVIKPQPDKVWFDTSANPATRYDGIKEIPCPYGQPGDRLWVRETWAVIKSFDHLCPADIPKGSANWPVVWYAVPEIAAASIKNTGAPVGKTRPSIFMPRWASRLTLEITGIRVERVQSISGKDVLAEGVDNGKSNSTMGARWENMQRMAFEELWDSINGKRPGCTWNDNPYVWCISFQRVGAND